MDEFSLIKRYFAGLSESSEGVVLGIGDDAALLQVPQGAQLVVTTDTLVAGRHFPHRTLPFDIGWKALAVNLSDLAAMAATPRWFTLALTLPEPNADWLAAFAAGLKALADAHGIALVGGDTTRGPLSITITAMGSCVAGQALRRDGARPGDVIAVTGTLGDAALALQRLATPDADDPDAVWLQARLDRPSPRLQAASALREFVSAAVDVSDGLAADLGHILEASACGATLQAEHLPQSKAFASRMQGAVAVNLQLHGGDDYELCFCIPPQNIERAQAACLATNTPFTVIGRVTDAAEGYTLHVKGRPQVLHHKGFNHFAQ